MNTTDPPTEARRGNWRQPISLDDLFDELLEKSRHQEQNLSEQRIGELLDNTTLVRASDSQDARARQLLAIAADPSACEDNREAAAHDLGLEFGRSSPLAADDALDAYSRR